MISMRTTLRISPDTCTSGFTRGATSANRSTAIAASAIVTDSTASATIRFDDSPLHRSCSGQ